MPTQQHQPLPQDLPTPVELGSFLTYLGFEPIEMADGRARIRLVIDQRHLRSLNMAHGGVVATLVDSILGIAAHSRAPEGHYTVTVQLNINYTRPALPGEELMAVGECQHHGKRTAVSRGEVRNQHGDLIATGSATLMYLPKRK